MDARITESVVTEVVQAMKEHVALDTRSSTNAATARSNGGYVDALRRRFERLVGELQLPPDQYQIVIRDAEFPPGVPQQTFGVRVGPRRNGGVVFCGHADVVDAPWGTPDQQVQFDVVEEHVPGGATDADIRMSDVEPST